MNLDHITVALRPRRPWEGLDLGFTLARRWFPSLWLYWWLGALPLALLAPALVHGRADLWVVVLWWFKPLYEAPLICWISRATFGERPALRDAGGLLKAAWTPRLIPYLLWRRLSPSRSFNLPIVLLEGLRGSAVRRRRRVLSEGDTTATWLTLICYHFEAILWGGALLTLYFLIPQGLPRIDLASAVTDAQSWPYWLSSALGVLAYSVIAPFYCCAGFALYIGRRTDLEAWDLELAFRRVAAPAGRLRRHSARMPAASAAEGKPTGGIAPRNGLDRPPRASRAGRVTQRPMVLLTTAILTWPGAVPLADPVADTLPDRARTRTMINEVLADEAFGHTREITIWTPRGSSAAAPHPAAGPAPGEWLQGLARGVKWLLAAAAIIAVSLLLHRVLHDWEPGSWRRRGRTAPATSTTTPGARLAVDPDPQAAALAAAVGARLAEDDLRGAMALLYRGGINHLRRRGVPLTEGATEGECLRLATRHRGAMDLAPFRHLTHDWQALAYAQRQPDAPVILAHLTAWLRWTADAAPNGDPTPGEARDAV